MISSSVWVVHVEIIINAIGSICQAHFCTMATDTKEVKRCFYCGKEAKKTKRTIFCTTCKKNPKFSLPVEITPEELETQYKDVMVYCYNCGEELFKEDGVIMCPDGCGLIDITVDQASVSLNQERTVSEPQDNAKDTVSSPLCHLHKVRPQVSLNQMMTLRGILVCKNLAISCRQKIN